MELPDIGTDSAVPTMRTLAMSRPRPGTLRMTSILSSGCYRPDWSAETMAELMQFPGVRPEEFDIRRFDASSGIVDVDFTPSRENTMLRRWLESVEVGTNTRMVGPDSSHFPNFRSGRRVHLFIDDSSIPAVHAILEQWPDNTTGGTVWIDTPCPALVASLPVVDGVSVISFHIEMGFDPLVTAARRLELDRTTTVWAAGETTRMDAIRATCLAAGLSDDDTRVFGFWTDTGRRRLG
ncbi:MAG: SIP domain-containing protein [Rhodococcus sp. (in: high G+C Gram-positive bacteria)]